jgi:hypothetical protein
LEKLYATLFAINKADQLPPDLRSKAAAPPIKVAVTRIAALARSPV